MSEEINVDEVIRTIQFSEIAQKGYKVMSNDEFDRIVNGVIKLQQENQQLKEQVDNCISNEMKQQLEISNLRQENQQLKEELDEARDNVDYYSNVYWEKCEVLDEIREFIKKCSFSIEGITNEYHDIVYAEDIEEILDKVKE